MKVNTHKKPFEFRSKKVGVCLIILLLIIYQAQSIKFAKKQTSDKNKQSSQTINPNKNQNPNQAQNPQVKTTEPPLTENLNASKQPQKPMQIKPEIQITPSVVALPKKQQKSQPKPSQDNKLADLFGQSTQNKNKATIAVQSVNIIPQKHQSVDTPSNLSPSTTPVSTITGQKTSDDNNMIGGLFAGRQIAKPKQVKTITQKAQQKPEVIEKTLDNKQTIQGSKTEQNSKAPLSDLNKKIVDESSKDKIKQVATNSQKKLEATQKNQQKNSEEIIYPSSKKKMRKNDKTQQQAKKEQQDSQEKKPQDQNIATAPTKQPPIQQDESQQIIYPKNMKDSSKKTKTKAAQSGDQNPQQVKKKYSLTLVLTFCVYSLIIAMVVITIRCTSTQSKAVKAVGIMIHAVGDLFKKRQGYRPTLNQEQVTQRQEQITVGYNVEDDNNKQIFWEKNSVQGI